MAISVSASATSGLPLEQEVDADITEFETYFCTTVDTSAAKLTGPERAIIKTYLAHKLGIGPAPRKVE
jgi:hypothetical protein